MKIRRKRGISKAQAIMVAIVVVVVAAGGGYFAFTTSRATTTTITTATLAAPQISSVTDPKGDQREGSPAYRDIVKAEITKRGETFAFRMELASVMPEKPPLPSGVVEEAWEWALETDPGSTPTGFPLASGELASFPPQVQVGDFRSVGLERHGICSISDRQEADSYRGGSDH